MLVVPSRAAGEDYGDDATGNMLLMWRDALCEVTACATPKHRVTTKLYCVVAAINEYDKEILNVKCQDCIAAQGPCKHVTAFLAWLER